MEIRAQTRGRLSGDFKDSARVRSWTAGIGVAASSSEQSLAETASRRRLVTPSRILLLLLAASVPLLNPWVHGDGVGYYAYVHSLMIGHNLDFTAEWRAANATFAESRTSATGQLLPDQFTRTGHVDNHFAVGPAILWAPFLVPLHGVLLALKNMNVNVSADGYSRPYLWTMAFATLIYGFAGLWLSFTIARKFVGEWWAFCGTVGIWFASSLPVYMYLNPSWSHAHSLFAVALFLWYWLRTREQRSLVQWVWLGLAAGLMVNVYYLNAIVLLLPACESIRKWFLNSQRSPRTGRWQPIVVGNFVFVASLAAALLPTLITRKIIYGSFFSTGYPAVSEWSWLHPRFATILFSSDHGLLSWTPVIALALIGLLFFVKIDREFAMYCWVVTIAFAYVIACYANWDGISSFGNRFFLSLAPVFIIGLSVFFQRLGGLFASRRLAVAVAAATLLSFALWNFGFIFQWGAHMVPVRGPISWRLMARNQFTVVPSRVRADAEMYLLRRGTFLRDIEQRDQEELRERAAEPR